MRKKFIVMAHRSAASVFGEAHMPCKGPGNKEIRFNTREAADEYKKSISDFIRNPNVTYTVEEICA